MEEKDKTFVCDKRFSFVVIITLQCVLNFYNKICFKKGEVWRNFQT